MIGLGTLFWLMILFFGFIGMLRGWTKEVIVTSGAILSLFALDFLGPTIVQYLGAPIQPNIDPVNATDIRRRQFYILSVFHIAVMFVSYQGPAIAGRGLIDRLKIRDSFQDKLLGLVLGSLNGYLIIGTLWSFLENWLTPDGLIPLPLGIDYPFTLDVIVRPAIDSPVYSLIGNLPLPLLSPFLPVLLIVVFLFVIIVLI